MGGSKSKFRWLIDVFVLPFLYLTFIAPRLSKAVNDVKKPGNHKTYLKIEFRVPKNGKARRAAFYLGWEHYPRPHNNYIPRNALGNKSERDTFNEHVNIKKIIT